MQDADAAVAAADAIGYPVVLKIASPDIAHKSDIGGVILGLQAAGQVRQAADGLLRDIPAAQPAARIDGVLVARQDRRRRRVHNGHPP